MNEEFEKWWERSTPLEDLARNKITKSKAKRAYTAGLLRAADICKSKHENMDSRLNYVAGWLDAEAAIRKEAVE